ncbi:putative inner membrane protein [Oxobacter pfennigii]|uniref:Putative inner membrane protein n=1 Tax=Oxobacter pfennigii TaxID=36849 RepID=A0A0P8WC57_9CLOT|nr:putative inner membrane protein [Oxobacter pfennigii]
MTKDEISIGKSQSLKGNAKTGSAKKTKSQIGFGILLIIAMIIFGIYLLISSVELTFFWITGICFGFVLQKSRFCFVASMRDPYLTGSTSLTRALLIALAITTVGFTAIKYIVYLKDMPLPGQSAIVPISIATIAGAVIFGIGMVIAGGCATGTLMRTGEGHTMQMVTFIFFIIGSLWGAKDFKWWESNFIKKGPAIFMPEMFGWLNALIIQLLIIGILYYIAYRWEKRNAEV